MAKRRFGRRLPGGKILHVQHLDDAPVIFCHVCRHNLQLARCAIGDGFYNIFAAVISPEENAA